MDYFTISVFILDMTFYFIMSHLLMNSLGLLINADLEAFQVTEVLVETLYIFEIFVK